MPQSGLLTAGVWDDNRNDSRFRDYRHELDQLIGRPPFTDAEFEDAHERFLQAPGARQSLDIAFVIDTTGSMGDELTYLQSEFASIARAIEEQHPDAEQRYALVVYRDTGDPYVTRAFDFTTDPDEFVATLSAQSADGGGDLPEASDAALAETAELSFRDDEATARLAFWVGDAPHHDQAAGALAEAVRDLQALDVHIYPVASSGVDELAEFTMRSAAQLTGGRYLFLTDDSGIGGAHKEPSIPCYFVTRLDRAILRMVDIELTSVYREPTQSEVIRTGGDPQDGACELESGDVVFAF